jgi:hypothetical protein
MKALLRLAALAALGSALVGALATSARADELSPDELLVRHQPILVLDAFERFAPTTVDEFIGSSDLLQRGEDGLYHLIDPGPAGLPVRGDGLRLDVRGCDPLAGLAALSCYDALDTGPTAVYGRVDVHAGAVVLQYWFFYAYDFWSLQYPPSNLVWQAHEGDWEVVSVVLDEQRQPVEAAYSQHCTGQRKAWAAVAKAGDHPLVFVANGSHANLFAAGVRPIARPCIPPQALALLDQLQIVPLDVAVPGRTIGPGALAIERIHDNSPRWLRFPGTFGATQWIHAPAPIGNLVAGAGPESPQLHDVWADPLGTIAGYPAG